MISIVNLDEYELEEYKYLRTRVPVLEEAIKSALNELDEPQIGYPTPVANAIEILKKAYDK